MNHARRIQFRAVRRMGELREAIEPGKTGPKAALGSNPQLSRRKVAKDAGSVNEGVRGGSGLNFSKKSTSKWHAFEKAIGVMRKANF